MSRLESFFGKKSFITKLSKALRHYFSDDLLVRSIYVVTLNDDSNAVYRLTFIQRIFMTLQDPTASSLGKMMNIVMMFLIILSVISFILSTCSTFRYSPTTCKAPTCSYDPLICPNKIICEPVPIPAFDSIEIICVTGFTVEYISRLLLCWTVPARLAGVLPPNWDENMKALLDEERRKKENEVPIHLKKQVPEKLWDSKYESAAKGLGTLDLFYPPVIQITKYFLQFFNLIDVGAILPFYLLLVLGEGNSVSIIRVLRLARIFRVFKLGRNNEAVTMLSRTIIQSKAVLSLLFFFMILGVVLFGSLQYFFEQGSFQVLYPEVPNGAYYRKDFLGREYEVSEYTSMIISFYWAVVTLTTTGYGDVVPHSDFGRFLANFTMIVGVLMIALPISVIGNNFHHEYSQVHGKDGQDQHTIYDCLVELANDDIEYDEDKKLVPLHVRRGRKLAACNTLITLLDPVKQMKLKRLATKAFEHGRRAKGSPAKPLFQRPQLKDSRGLKKRDPSYEDLEDFVKSLVEGPSDTVKLRESSTERNRRKNLQIPITPKAARTGDSFYGLSNMLGISTSSNVSPNKDVDEAKDVEMNTISKGINFSNGLMSSHEIKKAKFLDRVKNQAGGLTGDLRKNANVNTEGMQKVKQALKELQKSFAELKRVPVNDLFPSMDGEDAKQNSSTSWWPSASTAFMKSPVRPRMSDSQFENEFEYENESENDGKVYQVMGYVEPLPAKFEDDFDFHSDFRVRSSPLHNIDIVDGCPDDDVDDDINPSWNRLGLRSAAITGKNNQYTTVENGKRTWQTVTSAFGVFPSLFRTIKSKILKRVEDDDEKKSREVKSNPELLSKADKDGDDDCAYETSAGVAGNRLPLDGNTTDDYLKHERQARNRNANSLQSSPPHSVVIVLNVEGEDCVVSDEKLRLVIKQTNPVDILVNFIRKITKIQRRNNPNFKISRAVDWRSLKDNEEFKSEASKLGRILILMDSDFFPLDLSGKSELLSHDILDSENVFSQGSELRSKFFSLLHTIICIHASVEFNLPVEDIVAKFQRSGNRIFSK